MDPPRTLPVSQLFIPRSPGWPSYSEAPQRLNGETWSAEGACGWDECVPGAGLPMDPTFSDCPPLPLPTLRPCLITDGHLHSSGGRGAFPEGSTSYQSLPTRSCMALLSPPGLRPQGRTTLHEGPCLPNSSPSPGLPVPHAPSPSSTPGSAEALTGWALLYTGLSQHLGITTALYKADKRSLLDMILFVEP